MIIIVVVVDDAVVCHRPFLPDTSLEPMMIPTAQASKFQTAIFSILCVMFQAQLSFVVNLLNIFLVGLSNISLNILLLFQWPQILPV